ncbi:hypothetical protein NLI96_g7291 [Meripilus lineatus]|uniref:F-box domain-containing protein n=1 Tax=Meripilus lineatus TaxID=2056292 RepID=A0AAD5UZP5_9APHY|nr:hypothetical protein NLI96_g7291 [Physisporinus lineatus]
MRSTIVVPGKFAQETWLQIFTYVDVTSFAKLRMVSKNFHNVLTGELNLRYNKLLRNFVADPEQFRQTMEGTDSFLGGAGVRLLLQFEQKPSTFTLQLYTREHCVKTWQNVLGKFGYKLLTKQPFTKSRDDGIQLIEHTFVKGRHSINIMVSQCDIILFPSSRFEQTSDFAIASGNCIIHGYPNDLSTDDDENSAPLAKPTHSFHKVEGCIKRRFGDSRSLVVRLSETADNRDIDYALPAWHENPNTHEPMQGFGLDMTTPSALKGGRPHGFYEQITVFRVTSKC